MDFFTIKKIIFKTLIDMQTDIFTKIYHILITLELR